MVICQGLGVKIGYAGLTAGAYANELTKDSSDLVTENDAMTATWVCFIHNWPSFFWLPDWWMGQWS